MVDEAYIEMRCYIKYNLYYGKSEELIKQELIKAGWPLDRIKQALMELRGIKPVKKEEPVQAESAEALPTLEAPSDEAPVPSS